MKKKSNGKVKGGKFERQISKRLSLWLSSGERDDMFWRTHGSGSRYTIRNKKDIDTEGQDGDICSTCSGDSEKFRKIFSLELKNYKDINLWGLVTKNKTGFLDFWRQTVKQAESVNKIPVLIIKENYRPILFVSNLWTKYLFGIYFDLEYDMEVNIGESNIYVWHLEDVLKVKPKTFMNAMDVVLEENDGEFDTTSLTTT